MKKKLAICFGGNSVEHDVSILSALQVSKSIDRKKYDYVMIYISHDNHFYVSDYFDALDGFKHLKKAYEVIFYKDGNYLNIRGLNKKIPKKFLGPIDVVIPVVHGKNTEDGTLYGFFKMFDVAICSTSILGSSLMQDKVYTKKILESFEIPVLDYCYFSDYEWYDSRSDCLKLIEEINYPVIVKPSSLGSSIGINIVNNQEQLLEAILEAFKYDKKVIIEKALTKYREFNCAFLGNTYNYEISEIEEVITKNEFLSFSDKYHSQATKILNPDIPTKLYNEITTLTEQVVKSFNGKGVLRVDFLYDIATNQLYVNEINTIPGSLAFNLFEARGIYFNELIDLLVTTALDDAHEEKQIKTKFNSDIFTKTLFSK